MQHQGLSPFLSVIIPAYNREASIGRAIDSVTGGPCDAFEVIVVDDGSSDATFAAARGALASRADVSGRVLQQPNSGPGAARNTGAAAARGRYLAFLDSDDLWFRHTLEVVLAALEEQDRRARSPALVFLQTVDVREEEIPRMGAENRIETLVCEGFLEAVETARGTRWGSNNVVIRRDVYEALGGFTAAVNCSEDTDMFLRAAASGPCMVLYGAPLVMYVSEGEDRLTGSFDRVLSGFEFLLAGEAAGRYPDPPTDPRLKDKILARSASHTMQAAFAAGRPGLAYKLYWRCLPRLWRARNFHWLLRLPVFPLLALLRPGSYRMRWTPMA